MGKAHAELWLHDNAAYSVSEQQIDTAFNSIILKTKAISEKAYPLSCISAFAIILVRALWPRLNGSFLDICLVRCKKFSWLQQQNFS